jgi:hypothetical protein
MRRPRLFPLLAFLLFLPAILLAQTDKPTPNEKLSADEKLTVMGKLIRVMAIGGETSGWAIELNPVLTVEGKQVSSIEIVAVDSKKLEPLENKTVKAIGRLSNAYGVETGQRPILTVSSIKPVKEKPTKERQ